MALHSPDIRVEHIALALTSMNDGVLPRIFTAIDVAPGRLHTELADRYWQAG